MNRRNLLTLPLIALASNCAAPVEAQRAKKAGKKGGARRVRPVPIKANIYADNWFEMYINGKLIAVDSIEFVPHNVISVDIIAEYPMTIACRVKDFADPKTGLEWDNSNIGDGGFILKLGDGTVTNSAWKAKKFSWGPLNGDMRNPRVVHEPIPDDWASPNFDDSAWGNSTQFTVEQVRPRPEYLDYDFKGAEFIWTEDLELDNTIIFRHRVESKPIP